MRQFVRRLLYSLRFACHAFVMAWNAWGLLHAYAESVANDDVAELEEEIDGTCGGGDFLAATVEDMQIAAGTDILESKGFDSELR
jgi:hypothetical protein